MQAMLPGWIGEEQLAAWKSDVDLGDFISVRGRVIARRGELSIMATKWTMAAKSLRPLPVAFADMNEETRVRQRYNDLIVREEARKNAMTRVKVMRALRNYLRTRVSWRSRPRCCRPCTVARLLARSSRTQRARHRPLPAYRAGVVLEARRRRRH